MRKETAGDRAYMVRLARGDGVKRPEKLEDFAAALNAAWGTRFDSSTLSRMENGDRRVTLEDCAMIAALDPRHRGPGWLAFGEEATLPAPVAAPHYGEVAFTPKENAAPLKPEAAEPTKRRKRGNGG